MAKNDKFKKLRQEGGGALSSFQDIATTVAAIEKQADAAPTQQESRTANATASSANGQEENGKENVRMTHLPSPSISMREYNLVSFFCTRFENMTRQDWMELAIIEKLHNDGEMPDEEFLSRQSEIRQRPPRGLRKNTKTQRNKWIDKQMCK